MVKDWTGFADWDCIMATISEESMPPERNAPSGTSAIIRSATAWFRTASSRSSIASAGPFRQWSTPFEDRSEERRVGQGGVSTCSTRGRADDYKKKKEYESKHGSTN